MSNKYNAQIAQMFLQKTLKIDKMFFVERQLLFHDK